MTRYNILLSRYEIFSLKLVKMLLVLFLLMRLMLLDELVVEKVVLAAMMNEKIL